MKKIIGIMAATREGVIGHQKGLPWHYPEELDFFRKTTFGHGVIMGKNTYESIPAPFFKDRESIIFSRDPHFSPRNGHNVSSLEMCFKMIDQHVKSPLVFMIGGAQIAQIFLEKNLLDAFFLTEIHKNYPGDTRMDLLPLQSWPRTITQAHESYTIYDLRNPRKNNHPLFR